MTQQFTPAQLSERFGIKPSTLSMRAKVTAVGGVTTISGIKFQRAEQPSGRPLWVQVDAPAPAADATDRTVALLDNCRSPVSAVRSVTFDTLADWFALPKQGQKDGPAWMPVHIGLGHRTGERVESVSFLVMDVEADAEATKDESGNPARDQDGDIIKRVIGPEPPGTDEMLAELALWGWRAILHTSYSHTPEHPRYRLIFDLSRPLLPVEVKPLGVHISTLLGIADSFDSACLEPARLFYLPRCPGERLPLFRHGKAEGEPLPVDALLSDARKVEAARNTTKRRGGQSGGVIAAFNDATDICMILEKHGYIPKGRRRWLWPGSTTGLPGVRLLPDSSPERIYSSHAGDPLNDGHAHDAFDCWRILEHGGDMTAGVRAAARLLGMERPASDAAALMMGEYQPEEENATAGDYEGQFSDWPAPQALPDGLPPVAAFDMAMLPDSLRPWAADICERVQCAPDFVAVAIMAGLGSIIGRKVGIRPQARTDWTVTPNQWALVVGRPGVLKSPALEAALSPIKRLAAMATEAHQTEAKDYAVAAKLAKLKAEEGEKAARKVLARAPETDVSDYLAGEEPEAPALRRYIAVDSNAASLGELHRQNPNGFLVHRDEMVSLLKSLDREDQAEARGFYLTGWNGDSSYTFDRIGRGLNLHIPAVCLSMLGSTQPGRIAEYIRHAVKGGAGDDGLIQRFGLLVWPNIGGEWCDVDRWPDGEAKRAAFQIYERLDTCAPETIGAQRDTSMDGEPEGLPYLRFDAEALGLFLEWRTDLETRLRGGDLHPAMESHMAKYRKLVPSLALVLHLAGGDTGPVTERATTQALAWAAYLETHARRAYASVTMPEVSAAKAILARIRKGDLPRTFASWQVWRPGWAQLTDRVQVAEALGLLVELGWLAAAKTDTGGRPGTVYVVNPMGLA
jgi:hypothetical protein